MNVWKPITIIYLFSLLATLFISGCGKASVPKPSSILTTYTSTINITASSNSQVELSWNALPTADVLGFNVYRKIESLNGVFIRINPNIVTANTYTDTIASLNITPSNNTLKFSYHNTFLTHTLEESAASNIVSLLIDPITSSGNQTPSGNNTPATPSGNQVSSSNVISNFAPSLVTTRYIKNIYKRLSPTANFALIGSNNVEVITVKDSQNAYHVTIYQYNLDTNMHSTNNFTIHNPTEYTGTENMGIFMRDTSTNSIRNIVDFNDYTKQIEIPPLTCDFVKYAGIEMFEPSSNATLVDSYQYSCTGSASLNLYFNEKIIMAQESATVVSGNFYSEEKYRYIEK